MRSKQQAETPNEPKAWWQRALAGERLPRDLLRAKSKCHGTVEDHRQIAPDVRELIRKRLFEQPVGSVFRLQLPWLRMIVRGKQKRTHCGGRLSGETGKYIIFFFALAVSGHPVIASTLEALQHERLAIDGIAAVFPDAALAID
jgi:hypothetical protein